jgi:hypothetical protein
MPNAPENEPEFRDPDLERAVYRAMRSCGWILPKTPEELRQAEVELAANPVELPASLRDPFRVLDAPGGHPGGEHADPSPLGQLGDPELRIPTGLERLATEVGLSFDQVTSLINMQAQIIANRSTSRNEEPSYEDWKRFYDAVKEFL